VVIEYGEILGDRGGEWGAVNLLLAGLLVASIVLMWI